MEISFINQSEAKRVLKQAYDIVSKDCSDDRLQYIRFEIDDTTCQIVATNAYVLLLHTLKINQHDTSGTFYVHRDEFKTLMKLPPSGILRVSEATSDIAYPNYTQVMPNELQYQNTITIDTEELMSICKVAVKHGEHGKTEIALHDKKVTVTCQKGDFKSKNTITAYDHYSENKYFRVFFDPSLMLILLDPKLNEKTQISYNQAEQPIIVNHNLLMPIRQ